MPPSRAELQDFRDKVADRILPWSRSAQFWIRAVNIYAGYKACQFRAGLVKDEEERAVMWEKQHEIGAEKMYSLCSELGGLFLKAAQILAKPDLAPAAWVKKLVTLCDKAPATPIDEVKNIVEKQLGRSFDDIFERFDSEPIGSASIAQVHRARLKNGRTDVAVKVQHPGVQYLMNVDIHNLQAFALFLQKAEIKFDLLSQTKELEKQVDYEFDFVREANAMERIRNFLRSINRRGPVTVPRVIPGMVTREVLVMDFIEGTPIMNLGNEISKRGINPDGKVAAMAKQKILRNLTLAYGQMILKDGFFHADPHPGNILICKDSEVALLDYGQVKELPEHLRVGYANLMLAIADKDIGRIEKGLRELGIEITGSSADLQKALLNLALSMFDTKMPPGRTMITPFSDSSPLNTLGVKSFPEDLFYVLRTIQLLRGLSVGLGINYSCAEQWRPIAEEALSKATSIKVKKETRHRRGLWGRILRGNADSDN